MRAQIQCNARQHNKTQHHQILTGNCRIGIGGILGFNTTEIKQQARIQTGNHDSREITG